MKGLTELMNGQTATITHRTEPSEPRLVVTLERGQRGGYGWSIKYDGASPSAVLAMLTRVDAALRAQYGVSHE